MDPKSKAIQVEVGLLWTLSCGPWSAQKKSHAALGDSTAMGCRVVCLPSEVREGLVGFRHTVRILTA